MSTVNPNKDVDKVFTEKTTTPPRTRRKKQSTESFSTDSRTTVQKSKIKVEETAQKSKIESERSNVKPRKPINKKVSSAAIEILIKGKGVSTYEITTNQPPLTSPRKRRVENSLVTNPLTRDVLYKQFTKKQLASKLSQIHLQIKENLSQRKTYKKAQHRFRNLIELESDFKFHSQNLIELLELAVQKKVTHFKSKGGKKISILNIIERAEKGSKANFNQFSSKHFFEKQLKNLKNDLRELKHIKFITRAKMLEQIFSDSLTKKEKKDHPALLSLLTMHPTVVKKNDEDNFVSPENLFFGFGAIATPSNLIESSYIALNKLEMLKEGGSFPKKEITQQQQRIIIFLEKFFKSELYADSFVKAVDGEVNIDLHILQSLEKIFQLTQKSSSPIVLSHGNKLDKLIHLQIDKEKTISKESFSETETPPVKKDIHIIMRRAFMSNNKQSITESIKLLAWDLRCISRDTLSKIQVPEVFVRSEKHVHELAPRRDAYYEYTNILSRFIKDSILTGFKEDSTEEYDAGSRDSDTPIESPLTLRFLEGKIEFFIKVAETSFELNDFHTLQSIVAALNNVTISRFITKKFPKTSKATLEKITNLFSSATLKGLKKALNQVNSEKIFHTYPGILLSNDIIKIMETVEDTTQKIGLVAKIVKKFLTSQKSGSRGDGKYAQSKTNLSDTLKTFEMSYEEAQDFEEGLDQTSRSLKRKLLKTK